jgi:hypothetical protein
VAGPPLRCLSTIAVGVAVFVSIVLLYGLPLEGARSAVETIKAVSVVTFLSTLVAALTDVVAG